MSFWLPQYISSPTQVLQGLINSSCWNRAEYDRLRRDWRSSAHHMGCVGLGYQTPSSLQTVDCNFGDRFGNALGNIWFPTCVGDFRCSFYMACRHSSYYLLVVELHKRWRNSTNDIIGEKEWGCGGRRYKKNSITHGLSIIVHIWTSGHLVCWEHRYIHPSTWALLLVFLLGSLCRYLGILAISFAIYSGECSHFLSRVLQSAGWWLQCLHVERGPCISLY